MKRFYSMICICFLVMFGSMVTANAEGVEVSPDLKIVINGDLGKYTNTPILVNGSTLLPLREILQNIGVQNDDKHIIWNENENSVTIYKDSTKVKLFVDNKTAYVNDNEISLNAAPIVYNNRTYIPARFVSQSFGKKVVWDGNTKTVYIRDEAEFNKVKTILDKTQAAMGKLDSYTEEKHYLVNFETGSIKSSKEDVLNVTVDRKNNNGTMNEKISSSVAGKTISTNENLYYLSRNKMYFIEDGKWMVITTNDKTYNDLYNGYDYLRSNDILCASLKITENDTGSIILSGNAYNVWQLSRFTNMEKLKDLDVTDSFSTISVDKNKYIIKDMNVKFSAFMTFGDLKINYNFSIVNTITKCNETNDIKFPEDLEKILVTSSQSSVEEYIQKGLSAFDEGDYEQALKFYEEALSLNPKNYEALYEKAYTLYYMGEYKKSNEFYDKVLELKNNDSDTLLGKANNYIGLGEYNKVIELCDKALENKDLDYVAYYTKSLAYARIGKYSDSLLSINKSIELNSKFQNGYVRKSSILYQQKEYTQCIDFTTASQTLFPKNEELPKYKAYCYLAQFQYEKGIKAYEEILKINPDNDIIIAYIGWGYYNMQDYKKAEEYANKALSLYEDNEDALELKDELEKVKEPEAKRIVDFVQENYLYYTKQKDIIDSKSKEFANRSDVNISDIEAYINGIKQKDDIFSFVISGEDYDYYTNIDSNNKIELRNLDSNTYYIKIGSFTASTGVEFKKAIDFIKDSENKSLVIDLRDNGGGLSVPSNAILDYLLPACTTSYLIDRDGYTDSFYSNEGQMKFKKIIVLVNEKTASSSELLTLGLKKYLNNVVVIGKPTFGKGVGQTTFENKSKKYIVFLVNHYWNVREENIMGGRITPDITVNGQSNEDYLYEINKILSK